MGSYWRYGGSIWWGEAPWSPRLNQGLVSAFQPCWCVPEWCGEVRRDWFNFFPEGACDFRRETRAQLTQGAKPWYDFLSPSSPLWREKQFQYQGECQNVSTLDCSSRGGSARESNFMPPTHVRAVPTSFQLMKTWILHLGFFGSPSY